MPQAREQYGRPAADIPDVPLTAHFFARITGQPFPSDPPCSDDWLVRYALAWARCSPRVLADVDQENTEEFRPASKAWQRWGRHF